MAPTQGSGAALRGMVTVREAWRGVAGAAGFLGALPGFLRRPIDSMAALRSLAARLSHRETDFLALVARAVYGNPQSPYRALLAAAGCEPGDVAALVHREGVEGALRVLVRHGIYLTVDEFKGRQPIVRGRITVAADPDDFANPLAARHLVARTSGSRGRPGRVPVDLIHLRTIAADLVADLVARGGLSWEQAVWSVPGGGVLAHVLASAAGGVPPVRWFSHVQPGASSLPDAYRWSVRAVRWAARLSGVRLPWPDYASAEAPAAILRWIEGTLAGGRRPHLWTFASSAVRLAEAAQAAGVGLGGARVTMSGEPVTASRVRVVRAAGAEPIPRYAAAETGPIGLGCMVPSRVDEVHVLGDLHAVVQPNTCAGETGLPRDALLVSAVRPTAPVVLLNVSLGDCAVLGDGGCGCPLETLGWTMRLHTVRSHEKLTSGGMTFLDADVVGILEDVLPARFGGSAAHYQLVESQPPDGHAEVRLLVHPAVGPLDPADVREAFLGALSASAGPGPVMGLAWREAALLRVERRAPLATRSGKILHLHLDRITPRGRT